MEGHEALCLSDLISAPTIADRGMELKIRGTVSLLVGLTAVQIMQCSQLTAKSMHHIICPEIDKG